MEDPLTSGGAAPLRRIAPDGAVTTVLSFGAASLPSSDQIGTLVVDGARRLYFMERERCALHRVDLAKPVLETLAAFPPAAFDHCSIKAELAMDRDGSLYYIAEDAAPGTLALKKRSPVGMVTTAVTSRGACAASR